MRRWLSIFLVLFFGVGPFVAIFAASDESRLPFCCRRHGAHHCGMSTQMAAMTSAADPGTLNIKAPATCPWFPGYLVTLNTTALALAPAPVSLPTLLAEPHSPAAGRAAARISQIRTRANRGPPTSSIA